MARASAIYSASKVAEEEFPDLSTPERGAISIARRVLDPMSEYVKINPKNLGVGQYQHDIDEKSLEEALNYTVDKSVNTLGINLQTASKSLLEHIAGLSGTTAEAIIEARDRGELHERDDLISVSGIGHVTYEQAVGFIRMYTSDNPLDKTMIHPDHYAVAIAIIEDCDENIYSRHRLSEGQRSSKLRKIDPKKYATDLSGEEMLGILLKN